MSKYIAHSPNGTAYECDTLAEVRRVEGRKHRNPSEDYSIGLFQGAMEHGKLKPAKESPADYKKGYADGFKVGRAKPEARAQALGVYKATGNQRQSGETLYELSQGLSTVANPRKRRNPAKGGFPWTLALVGGAAAYAYGRKKAKKRNGGCGCGGKCGNPHCGPKHNPKTTKVVEAIDTEGKPFLIPYFEKAGPFVRSTTLIKGETPETVKDDFTAGVITHLPTRAILYRAYVTRYSSAKDKAVIAMKALRSWLKTLTPEQVRTISEGFTPNSRSLTPEQDKLLRQAVGVCMGQLQTARNPRRNPASAPTAAQKRKHMAHEREEEATFKTMLDKLPVGVTLKAGKHRVRKLSKGYVVIDGERLTDKEAAKKIHRG